MYAANDVQLLTDHRSSKVGTAIFYYNVDFGTAKDYIRKPYSSSLSRVLKRIQIASVKIFNFYSFSISFLFFCFPNFS